MTNFIQFIFKIVVFSDKKLRKHEKKNILNDKDIKKFSL